MRRLVFMLVLLAAFGGLAGPAQARRVVPKGFFGTVLDGKLQEPNFPLSGETSLMSRSGVETVRYPAYWNIAQPYPNFASVPASERGRYRNEGGVPTYWFDIDRMVRAAAARGLRSLPVLLNAPVWGRQYRDRAGSPPVPESFARFAALLVRRYGPGGAFWAENPGLRRVPVRSWQILNEVNHTHYWNTPGSDPSDIDNTSSAPGYVNLLRVTRPAIKAVDPGAKIVHAGTDSKAWRYVRAIYHAGGRRLFDVFAVHPFTDTPNNQILILRYVRRAMNHAHDGRKPILVTEWSWPSARGHAPDPGHLSTNSRGQARRITQSQKLFVRWRRKLRLSAVLYYNWLGQHIEGNRFTFAGLRYFKNGHVFRKLALSSYARSTLAYEGCRKKSSRSATRCLKRRR